MQQQIKTQNYNWNKLVKSPFRFSNHVLFHFRTHQSIVLHPKGLRRAPGALTSDSIDEVNCEHEQTSLSNINFSLRKTRSKKNQYTKIEYNLENFIRSNQDTCLNHKPGVFEGDWVQSGDFLTDCANSVGGELALGQNIFIAYMPWEGYNFEDAILISQRLVTDDLFTSIHIERYEIENLLPLGALIANQSRTKKSLRDGVAMDGEQSKKEGSRASEDMVSKRKGMTSKTIESREKDMSLKVKPGKASNPLQTVRYEEITRDIPDVSQMEISNLDSFGIIKIGSFVEEGDILVGKRKPINKKDFTPYQKLLYTILNKQLQPYRDTSLRAPKGIKAKVIDIKFFVKPGSMVKPKKGKSKVQALLRQSRAREIKKAALKKRAGPCLITSAKNLTRPSSPGSVISKLGFEYNSNRIRSFLLKNRENKNWTESVSLRSFHSDSALNARFSEKNAVNNQESVSIKKGTLYGLFTNSQIKFNNIQNVQLKVPGQSDLPVNNNKSAFKSLPISNSNKRDSLTSSKNISKIIKIKKCKIKKNLKKYLKETPVWASGQLKNQNSYKLQNTPLTISSIKNLETIHIYLAEKRKVQVGDKMSGRHGNKGIVSQILPIQDMPFLPDGTPIDMILNPLGVPSRMNVGQIYECLLGLAGRYLGENYKIFAFDETYGAEASRSFVFNKLFEASSKTGFKWLFNPTSPGKIRLYDGRTGDCFDQPLTVGQTYMLRLVHMVDDKIHMRSTGPYSLVTQQPLRGRSKQGGQRLGEMEVWALEGYGAAFTLLEMLTVKSDDLTGRMTLWSNLILNKDLTIGTPEAFKVLICELQALCLDIGLFRYNTTDENDIKYSSRVVSPSTDLLSQVPSNLPTHNTRRALLDSNVKPRQGRGRDQKKSLKEITSLMNFP